MKTNTNTLQAIHEMHSLLAPCDDMREWTDDNIKHDYLTINEARNGRTVLWYMDECRSLALYTDTLCPLTDEEIETELC